MGYVLSKRKLVAITVLLVAVLAISYVALVESMDRSLPIATSYYYWPYAIKITKEDASELLSMYNLTLPDISSLGYEYVYYFRLVKVDDNGDTKLTNSLLIVASHKPLEFRKVTINGKELFCNGEPVVRAPNFVGVGKTLIKDAEPPNLKIMISCYSNATETYIRFNVTPNNIEEFKKKLLYLSDKEKTFVSQGRLEIKEVGDWPIYVWHEYWDTHWDSMTKIYYPNGIVAITPNYRIAISSNDMDTNSLIELYKQFIGG